MFCSIESYQQIMNFITVFVISNNNISIECDFII